MYFILLFGKGLREFLCSKLSKEMAFLTHVLPGQSFTLALLSWNRQDKFSKVMKEKKYKLERQITPKNVPIFTAAFL